MLDLSSRFFLLLLASSPLPNFPAKDDTYNLKWFYKYMPRSFFLEVCIHPK